MFKSVVKVCGSTVKLQLILDILSAVEAGGKARRMGGVNKGAQLLGGRTLERENPLPPGDGKRV